MRSILLGVAVVVVVLASGCASDNGINETGYSDKPLVDQNGNKLTSADAKRIYRSAHQYLVDGEPDKALRLYANINARFPFSPFAEQAALESIAAHYRAEEYKAAIKAEDQFIKQRPQSPHIDYVYYMRGLSNFHYNKKKFLGAVPDLRNVSHLVQAFSDFKLLLNNYPNSDYAADARQHMIDIRNRVADFNLKIASYYLARKAYVGASRRAEKIVNEYQGSKATPKALQIMQQSYAALQLPELASDARALLQDSYPDYILNGDHFAKQAESANDTNEDDNAGG